MTKIFESFSIIQFNFLPGEIGPHKAVFVYDNFSNYETYKPSLLSSCCTDSDEARQNRNNGITSEYITQEKDGKLYFVVTVVHPRKKTFFSNNDSNEDNPFFFVFSTYQPLFRFYFGFNERLLKFFESVGSDQSTTTVTSATTENTDTIDLIDQIYHSKFLTVPQPVLSFFQRISEIELNKNNKQTFKIDNLLTVKIPRLYKHTDMIGSFAFDVLFSLMPSKSVFTVFFMLILCSRRVLFVGKSLHYVSVAVLAFKAFLYNFDVDEIKEILFCPMLTGTKEDIVRTLSNRKHFFCGTICDDITKNDFIHPNSFDSNNGNNENANVLVIKLDSEHIGRIKEFLLNDSFYSSIFLGALSAFDQFPDNVFNDLPPECRLERHEDKVHEFDIWLEDVSNEFIDKVESALSNEDQPYEDRLYARSRRTTSMYDSLFVFTDALVIWTIGKLNNWIRNGLSTFVACVTTKSPKDLLRKSVPGDDSEQPFFYDFVTSKSPFFEYFYKRHESIADTIKHFRDSMKFEGRWSSHVTFDQDEKAFIIIKTIKIIDEGKLCREETYIERDKEAIEKISKIDNYVSFFLSKSISKKSCLRCQNTKIKVISDFAPCGNLSQLIDSESIPVGISDNDFIKIDIGIFSQPQFKLAIAREICMQLQTLHQNDIVHRDLKPENIVLDEELHPFLIDYEFSLTMFMECQKSTFNIGTKGYIAPENSPVLGKNGVLTHDKESMVRLDIYSLGVIFYMLFSSTRSAKGPSIPFDYLETNSLLMIMQPLIEACTNTDPLQRPSLDVIIGFLDKVIDLIADKRSTIDLCNNTTNCEAEFNQNNHQDNNQNKINNLIVSVKSRCHDLVVKDGAIFKRSYLDHISSLNDLNEKWRTTPRWRFGTIENIKKGAQKKVPNAIYLLALIYFFGIGVEKNVHKAFEILEEINMYDYVEKFYRVFPNEHYEYTISKAQFGDNQ